MSWKDKLYLIPIYKSDRLWEIGIIISSHYWWITTEIYMLITSLIILLETNIFRPEGPCSLLMSYRRQKSRNIIRITLCWLLQFTCSLLKDVIFTMQIIHTEQKVPTRVWSLWKSKHWIKTSRQINQNYETNNDLSVFCIFLVEVFGHLLISHFVTYLWRSYNYLYSRRSNRKNKWDDNP